MDNDVNPLRAADCDLISFENRLSAYTGVLGEHHGFLLPIAHAESKLHSSEDRRNRCDSRNDWEDLREDHREAKELSANGRAADGL